MLIFTRIKKLRFPGVVYSEGGEMTTGMTGLIGQLTRLSWDKPAATHSHVEDILSCYWARRDELLRALQEHLDTMELPLVTRTAELHSWMLHNEGVWCLKLNQLLPSPCMGKRSENVHDHTRPLTSLTVTGGYQQDYFDADTLRGCYVLGDSFCYDDLPRFGGPCTSPGTVYTIDTDTFHALTDFADGTLTLCVYGNIRKEAIRVFNGVSGRVEQRTTYRSAKRSMISQLRALETSPAADS